jgi:hypothetical protein
MAIKAKTGRPRIEEIPAGTTTTDSAPAIATTRSNGTLKRSGAPPETRVERLEPALK